MFEEISEAFWLRAKEYVAEQGLKNTLKRNAQRESNELNMIKHCFLYCSLYPKDYPIGREHLIKLISEGLVDGRSWELPSEEEWTKDLEVSFLDYDIQRMGEGISPKCPMLSTLLLWGNQWLNYEITMPVSLGDLIGHKTALFLEDCCYKLRSVPYLGKMNALRKLDLSGTAIKKVPKVLGEPMLDSKLRSLKVVLEDFCYKCRCLPYLGMDTLWELDLSGTAIEEVPQVLEKFFNPKMKYFTKRLLQKLMVRAGNLHIGEPMLDSRGSQGERLLTNGMVGDAFIENPEMVLNRMEDRQVSQMPMAPTPSQSPPSLHTPMAPSPSQTPPSLQMLMAPSPSQTPPSAPPLMQFLQYVVPTMLVFLTMRYGAKPEALFGKHRIPLRCFIATTSIYWLTAGVMKQMALTTKASQMCYLVLSRIALASGIQSLLFLLSMFLNHVPPMMISLLISAPIALLIVHLLINMVFGAGERNSTDQPVRLPV